MRTLVLADIHANAPALKAVLEDAGTVDRVVFLGDLCNFGAYPSECVDLLATCDPLCVMGNHDRNVLCEAPVHPWNQWARGQLSAAQLAYLAAFQESVVLDGHILLVHGSYTVPYDILPNTSDEDIVRAFAHLLTPGVDQVWFGHYHYQIDRVIDGVQYHGIRPVGQHRDRDTRAGYSVYENGQLTHKRVVYELSDTLKACRELPVFENEDQKEMFLSFLENAYHEVLMRKDLLQMEKNAQAM